MLKSCLVSPRVRALRGDKRPGLRSAHPAMCQIHRSTKEVCYLAWLSSSKLLDRATYVRSVNRL